MELLAIWDYAGKIWYKGLSNTQVEELLQARVESPPGKVLKPLVFGFCHQLLDLLLPDEVDEVTTEAGRDGQAVLAKGLMEMKDIY
jgi:hypothetical protein